MRLAGSILFGILSVGALGCASRPPHAEWVLAETAIAAAKDAGAPRLAPAPWAEATKQLSLATRAYREQEFGLARTSFVDAKRRAEEAENVARLRRFETGEALP